MTRTIAICILICVFTILTVFTAIKPEILSDNNRFLAGFVPHEFLTIVGVMLTITLASAGQIHLTLNQIEEKFGKVLLQKTRDTVKSNAYWLIWLFLGSIILVVTKPSVEGIKWAESATNSGALFLLLWMTLIMTDLTQLIFAIKPKFPHSP